MMTVEQSWINRGCRHASTCDSMVPDPRLQAIAAAWNEYKEFASQSGAMAVLRERMDAVLAEENNDEN